MHTKVCNTSISPLSDRKMAFTISTSEVDRDGDTIDPQGWDYARYLKSNPVVLWAHDHSQPPIAKATSVWSTPSGLHAQVEFPPRGVYEFADTIHDLCKNGYLNATSVGFQPKAARPNKTGGQDISCAELLEFSIVSIGSNPSALVMQRGVNTAAMRKWLGQDDTVDLDAIFDRNDPEINWTAINRELAGRTEVNVTTDDVNRVVAHFAPALLDGVRAGLKLQAQAAAETVVRRMTGRLD